MHKILIVDDDETFVYTYQSLLTAKGYKVETVLNAIDIFKTIETFQPDLILLDTFLKNYDGRTIGRMIKLNENSSTIPIILCSMDPSVELTSFHQSADIFLSKPFDINTLVDAINSLLQKK